MNNQTSNPRHQDGKFASRQCPECYGNLQPEHDALGGKPVWRCDGLVDPENAQMELQPCEYELP